MKGLFSYQVMCSANKHLISACVQGARNIEINQREAWVEGKEPEAEADGRGAELDHFLFLNTWKI